MFDALFQALFGFRPVIFEQGEFRFAPDPGALAALTLGVAAIAATMYTYRQARVGRRRDRLVLIALRVSAIALVLACLFRPVLIVKAAVPQQNYLGILLDDSRSMQIADWDEQARAEFVRRQFGDAGDGVTTALANRFLIRTFRFSSSAGRVDAAADLTFEGSQTRLGDALQNAREELAGLPLAGLVIVSDGADTSEASLTEALLAMKAEALPVFTVGVGRESLTRDIQIDRVAVPRAILEGATLLIDVVVSQTGFAGETVTLDVEDDGRLVGSQRVTFPADGGPATLRVRAMANEAGPRVFRFRVPPQADELVTQNNVREALVEVRGGREKVLYFEGEPRFEMKFIRRAVADDENLQIVSLQRTADNKYLRLDVDHPEELVGGFPKTREELFSYRGLVLGSIEAGAFTADQLRMIADFVDRRGGGLLMLGGARSFGEGGYAGTPVADALPFVVERVSSGDRPVVLERLRVVPTRAGSAHAVTQIAESETASAARWADLPQVTSVNRPGEIKPGATVLLNGLDERDRARVVLASQRYGRGTTIAFTAQDSWLWQMHASVAVDDQAHENYWRQLLRWLVDGVPGPVQVQTTTERVEPGEAATLVATVMDPTFVELNDARVMARVTTPAGATLDVPLRWTGERDGQYRGTFTSGEPGAYHVEVTASRGETTLGTGAAYVRAAPSDAEYFDPTMHAARLRRIAADTGGRFYTPDTAANLAEDLQYAGRGVTTVEERELWNMPIVLATLVLLVGAEWGYRRAVGLA